MERSITVAGGAEASVEVTFEPSHLGDTQTTLTVSSPTGGDYLIPLLGHCLPPRPQGPYTIKPGSTVNIQFKNIFPQATQFKFTVDNPAFTVRAGDSIKAGKIYNISVGHDGKQAEPGVPRTGKLMVTAVQPKGRAGKMHGEIMWQFYLKGGP